ncbi:MAG: hypothetical protein AAGF95_33150 [Chloroflexota bacterium]
MNEPSPLATIPDDCFERWILLQDLINQWYPVLKAANGVSADDLDVAETRLSVTLPRAFREWYSMAGQRTDIWSQQDRLLHPSEFKLVDNYMSFMVENQHVVEWAICVDDSGLDDPPVYVSSADTPNLWHRANNTVSEFALQMMVSCLKWSDTCRWWANGYVLIDALDRVGSNYLRLPLAEWHWPAPTQFYGLRDIIIEAQLDDDGAWLYVVACTAEAAKPCKQLLETDIEWNAQSDGWPSV